MIFDDTRTLYDANDIIGKRGRSRGRSTGSKSGPFALMSLVRGLAEFTVVRMAWVRLGREEKIEREGDGKSQCTC